MTVSTNKQKKATKTTKKDETPVQVASAAPEIEPDNTPVTVLIPYLKSESAGEELKYALRAWQNNFKEDFRVVVIGDREDWFSPEVEHIPHTPHLVKEDCNCPNPSMIRNPQADVSHKLFTAISSGAISGDFILTNDDIYLLGLTFLEDIKTLKAFGDMTKGGKKGGLFNQNVLRTAKVLRENSLPIRRYGTHTPVLLNAEKLLEVIEKYDALEKAYLLTSLYFNELYPYARPIQVNGGINDAILASVYRDNVDIQLLQEIFAKRKFFNCNSDGWVSVRQYLEDTYPEPSRFEKSV